MGVKLMNQLVERSRKWLAGGHQEGYGDEYATHGQLLSGIEMNFGKLGKNHPTRYELERKNNQAAKAAAEQEGATAPKRLER